jgi:Xaa-Pro aminopeptidase
MSNPSPVSVPRHVHAAFGNRLPALRSRLAADGLSGFLVPRADEHNGEYIAPNAQRLAWLTGFDGSAGLVIVLADRAALFVDGRYTLQARNQVDTDSYEIVHTLDQTPWSWLGSTVRRDCRIGYDPRLHPSDSIEKFASACAGSGAVLAPCAENPIDALWTDRPPPPRAPVTPHDEAYAGRSSESKRREIAAELGKRSIVASVLTAPDSIAWLLNVRGHDVPNMPIVLCFAILYADASVDLFIDAGKVDTRTRDHLGAPVRLHSPETLGDRLCALAGGKVLVDTANASDWIVQRLTGAGASIVRDADPCQLPKACKNAVEISGARAAHVRDGVALCRFLAWFSDAAPRGELDEISAADRLHEFREAGSLFDGPSFDTISGAAANGAIVHYRATPATNRRIAPDMLYLVDSGAQYLDGTTDVTRTVAVGAPTNEMRERFTRVLKGHIALATARFPAGTTGSQLDALARVPLWSAGLDYDHGTGHGVGSYLGVHEGPQRIAKAGNAQALKPGMIVSNEPGYYKAGAYGIRIENLVVVIADPEPPEAAERPLLAFETLTRAPIDLALVEPSLLSAGERGWLNAYHGLVRADIRPLVDGGTARWLDQATRAV